MDSNLKLGFKTSAQSLHSVCLVDQMVKTSDHTCPGWSHFSCKNHSICSSMHHRQDAAGEEDLLQVRATSQVSQESDLLLVFPQHQKKMAVAAWNDGQVFRNFLSARCQDTRSKCQLQLGKVVLADCVVPGLQQARAQGLHLASCGRDKP